MTISQGEQSGIGEASPLPGYSPDDLASVQVELEQFLPFLERIPECPEDPYEIEALCAKYLACPSARFAVESALLALLSKQRNLPVHRLFCSDTVPLPVSGLLQGGSPEEQIKEAGGKAARGLRCLKLKVGERSVEEELTRLQVLQAALGPEIRLRLDANGAYTPGQVTWLAERLQGGSVVEIEEPVAPECWSELPPPPKGILWGADESLRQCSEELLRSPVCGFFVVKPAVLGWFGALRLAEQARTKGKGVIVTHLFDGPVALEACRELARALGPGLLPCGVDEHEALGAYPAWGVGAGGSPRG
ncbi:MAG: enolase C-terminal domain-like protein [Myxococcales bacterium]|nr:enolase C-terminal domain-like protein [Myxococcales bacterium]